MVETLEEMEARHKSEMRVLVFDSTLADRSKADADSKIATLTKASSDISTVVETRDSEYVTISYPTDKTGAEAVIWRLLIEKIEADPRFPTSSIRDTGTIRVHRSGANAVLDLIESTLP